MITLRPVQSDDDVEAWLPEARRRGVGSALLRVLGEHVAGLEVDRVGAHVDDGSQTFAERFGFEEIDRQVEQVVSLDVARDPA